MRKRILIATSNRGKAAEIISILKPISHLDIDFITSTDAGITDTPVEEGNDYETIASMKAKFYGERSRLVSIADDSGLEVFALDGYPGIKSARIESPEPTDKSKYEFLLDLMREIPAGNRGARFVCAACAYLPDRGKTIISRGEWYGEIIFESRGESGFGYDPIFYIPELGKTAAELSREEKNSYSHRGQAFRTLWQKLNAIF